MGAERTANDELGVAGGLGITTVVTGDDFDVTPDAWIEGIGPSAGLNLALRQTLLEGTSSSRVRTGPRRTPM